MLFSQFYSAVIALNLLLKKGGERFLSQLTFLLTFHRLFYSFTFLHSLPLISILSRSLSLPLPFSLSLSLSLSFSLSLSLSLSLILFLISFKRFSLLVFFFTLLLLPLSTFCFHSQFFQPVFFSFRHLFSLLYPIFSFYFLYAFVVTFAMSLPQASDVEAFFMSLLAFSSV